MKFTQSPAHRWIKIVYKAEGVCVDFEWLQLVVRCTGRFLECFEDLRSQKNGVFYLLLDKFDGPEKKPRSSADRLLLLMNLISKHD